jgi:HEAT repeat protein
MKRILLSLPLLVALAVPATVHAAPSAKLTAKVHALLSAPEDITTGAEWMKMGDDVDDVLQSVVVDQKAKMLLRARAAMALSHFKSDASKQVLASVVSNSKTYWILRSRAASSLARTYQADALPLIQPLLTDSHKRTREGAIKAFGLVDTAQSKTLLQGRVSLEKNTYLKGLINKTLARMNGGSK